MAGIFGNHPVDRWMEQQLNSYLNQYDEEGRVVELATGIVTMISSNLEGTIEVECNTAEVFLRPIPKT